MEETTLNTVKLLNNVTESANEAPPEQAALVPPELDLVETVQTMERVLPFLLALRGRVLDEVGPAAAEAFDAVAGVTGMLAKVARNRVFDPPTVGDPEVLGPRVKAALYELELGVDTLVRRREIAKADLPRKRKGGDPHGCRRLIELADLCQEHWEVVRFALPTLSLREIFAVRSAAYALTAAYARLKCERDTKEALRVLAIAYESARCSLHAIGLGADEIEQLAPRLPERTSHQVVH